LTKNAVIHQPPEILLAFAVDGFIVEIHLRREIDFRLGYTQEGKGIACRLTPCFL
jgi:hypothetical protein